MSSFQQMQQQNTQKVEASKVPEYIKKATRKAAEFNSSLNRERMEERRAYFDLQTHVGRLSVQSARSYRALALVTLCRQQGPCSCHPCAGSTSSSSPELKMPFLPGA